MAKKLERFKLTLNYFIDKDFAHFLNQYKDIITRERISKQSNRPFNNLVIKKIFVALIGPSLSGKTQSTYAMEDLRALYFALDQVSDKVGFNTQSIYTNYHSLNKVLARVAKKDIKI